MRRCVRCRDLAFVAADVTLLYDRGVPLGAADAVRALFSRKEVLIQKKTKRKALADVDLIPLIRSFELEEEERQLCIHTIVSAQNPGLNPALLAVAAEKELPQYVPDFLLVRRTDVLDAEGKPFR